jgi:hypothetical protein
MSSQNLPKRHKGQSVVEFALVLPFLLLLFIGLMESGYALYEYLVISNANREGVRLAARGRFTDNDIVNRLIGAGGYRKVDGVSVPLLSVNGANPNLGVIITHIPLPANVSDGWEQLVRIEACCEPNCSPDPNRINVTQCLQGVIAEDGETRDISSSDSTITDLAAYQESADATALINQMRSDGGFNVQPNAIVVVETFMAHPLLLHLPDYFPMDDPFSLYFKSSMRVTLNSRTQNQLGP